MISSHIIQRTLSRIAALTGVSAAVYGRDAVMIAEEGDMSAVHLRDLNSYIASGDATQLDDRFYVGRITDEGDTVYITVVAKDSENANLADSMLRVQLEGFLQVLKEKSDKDTFIRNLLMDNLLQIDIFNRSRRLGISFTEPRVVYIIKSDSVQHHLHEALRKVVSAHENDFLTGTDETRQIVVHQVPDGAEESGEIYAYAKELKKAVDDVGLEGVVAYGSVVHELKDVSRSFKEARLAYDVRCIFYEDQDIISYGHLGIGRLIYQLPIQLCKMFIDEIFGGMSLEDLDDEMVNTIDKFFENNLNVSETSRQLFIHRNTLVYRLDKLEKQTGLDLRVFEDAITFKIAWMVGKYTDYMDKMDF